MPVVITPESALGREMAKWEKPYHFEPFPQMLYRAIRRPDGVVVCDAESRACIHVVQSEAELSRAVEAGWRLSPPDALAFFESRERSKADAAAHRAYEDRNMGDAARAEAQAADDATHEHVAEVPEQRRQRGRPRKSSLPPAA